MGRFTLSDLTLSNDNPSWENASNDDVLLWLKEACGNWPKGKSIPNNSEPRDRERNQYLWLTAAEIKKRLDHRASEQEIEERLLKLKEAGIVRWVRDDALLRFRPYRSH